MATEKDTSTGKATANYTSSGLPAAGKGIGYNPNNYLTQDQAVKYEEFLSYSDNTQLSMALQEELNSLKNTADPSGQFNTSFDRLQALLRYTGLSKGKTDLGSGIWDPEDTKAFRQVLQTAYNSNVNYESVLEQYVAQGPQQKKPTTSFSKTISQSINLLDKGDAKRALSKAYFQTYNRFPTQKMFDDFEKKWNAEATRQAGKTTTTGTSTTTSADGKSSTVGTSTNVTVGKGFTAEEQQDFLAKYLQDNFKVNKIENLGGVAKDYYDTIVQSYSNNLMAPPEFPVLMKQVKDLIGTGDEEIRKQKIDNLNAKVRRQAKTLYQGYAEQLDAGDDLIEYAASYAQLASQELGRAVKPSEDLIKNILSFRDAKGVTRPASSTDAISMIRSSSEWDSSEGGKNYWLGVANSIRQGMGR